MDYSIWESLKKRNEIDEYKVLLQQSKGYEICLEILNSRYSFSIFLDNNRLLKSSFKELKSIDLSTVKEKTRIRIQRTFITRLHNTIGSAFSFQDHLLYRNNFNLSPDGDEIPVFFRLLRNFIIHTDTFPLLSKQTWKKGDITRRFDTMEKDKFLQYLDQRLIEKNDLKKQKSIQKIIDYVNAIPLSTDFRQIYDKYFAYIFLYHHLWIKKKLGNMLHVKEFLRQIDEYNQLVERHHERITLSLKSGEIYLKDNLDILSIEKLRYIKLLTTKRNWGKNAVTKYLGG